MQNTKFLSYDIKQFFFEEPSASIIDTYIALLYAVVEVLVVLKTTLTKIKQCNLVF